MPTRPVIRERVSKLVPPFRTTGHVGSWHIAAPDECDGTSAEYLSKKLTQPLPIKDGGVLRTMTVGTALVGVEVVSRGFASGGKASTKLDSVVTGILQPVLRTRPRCATVVPR